MNALARAVRRRRAEAPADAGAMLIIALIVITTVSLVTGALLAHSWTNLNATVSLRSVAGTSYAADTAAKLAVDNLRLGSTAKEWTTPGFNGTWNDGMWNGWVYANYSDGTGCFGAEGTVRRNVLKFGSLYPKTGSQTAATSARVECTPVPGTGILGGEAGVTIDDPDSSDPFAQALTTVGTSGTACGSSVTTGCNGTYVKVLGTGDGGAKLSAPFGGGIASRTGLTVDNGAITTDGFVYAHDGCTGTIISPDVQCSRVVANPPVPPSPLPAPPAVVTTMPTPVAGVCHFVGGTYISGEDLSAAVNACSTAFFDKGKYYFDFLDNKPWTISTKVIGGVSTGTASIPGACQSPIKFPGTDGVQFVFGGSSQVVVDNGAQVELCGPANSGDAPLTIYQQQASAGPTVTATATEPPVITAGSVGPNATAATVTTLPAIMNSRDAFVRASDPAAAPTASDLATDDATGAKWTSKKKGNTGQLDLSGFGAIPAGANVTSATLHLGLEAPAPSVPLKLTFAGDQDLGTYSATTDVTLSPAQVAALQSKASAGAYSPPLQITIPFTSNSPPQNATVTVDQVTLTVNYTTSSVPPPVITPVSLEPTTHTKFIVTKANSTARFVVQGATYAPTGAIDIDAGQTAFIAFRWGLLAEGVGFKTYPQQVFGYPLVSIPKPGKGLGKLTSVVDLVVYVCVQQTTCNSGGLHALTARVMITDPPYTDHPVAGKRRVQVLSWAEQR